MIEEATTKTQTMNLIIDCLVVLEKEENDQKKI